MGRNLPMHPQTHTKSRLGAVRTRKDQNFLDALDEVLSSNYTDRAFDLSQMAAEMGVKERQLQRKLKALTGHTPSDHLRTYRLQQSLEHLRDGISISAVAKAVGFLPSHTFRPVSRPSSVPPRSSFSKGGSSPSPRRLRWRRIGGSGNRDGPSTLLALPAAN